VNKEELNNYFKQQVQLPILSEDDKGNCEGKLTVEECKQATFSMARTNHQDKMAYPWNSIKCFGQT